MRVTFLAAAVLLLAAVPAPADTVLAPYQSAAQATDPAFNGFSVQRGEQLFRARGAGGVASSCTSCHTTDPRKAGQHEKTGKTIEPLAPVANAKRFTDPAKVEKWFKRNCREVLARECTALEKGDFVSWLRSVR